jgi:hypothetical protein
VTLQLAQVWREAEDREDSKLTFFLELPQATPSSSAVFYPNVGFIMGFVRHALFVVSRACACAYACVPRACVVCTHFLVVIRSPRTMTRRLSGSH